MAATGSTTRAERARGALLLLGIASLSLCLLLLAWPRLQASLNYLPVESAINQYWIDGELPTELLPALQERARHSASLHDHPRYWEGLSLLLYVQGGLPGQSLSDQREAFEQSVEAAERSLELAPVQPRLWMRKALALNWLTFRPASALEAFKMSVYTGRVEPQLFLSRMQLGYGRLNAMDDEARGLLADQTELAWKMRQADFIRALKRNQLSKPRIEFLLWDSHADLLAELEVAMQPRKR